MPRARIADHLGQQAAWDSALLKLSPAIEIAEEIRAQVRANGAISVRALEKLIKVPHRSLAEQKGLNDVANSIRASAELRENAALDVLRGYLPRVLGWRKVNDVALEIGIHRNSIVSFVRSFGDHRTLMYALDQRLYISPEGEKLVRHKTLELSRSRERTLLSDFAEAIGIKANVLRAYFSSRKVALERDPLGRVRLTEEQKGEILSWRDQVAKQRSHEDLIINGERYRSIIRVAQDKADLLATPGTTRHEQCAKREEAVLRALARDGGFAKRTGLGLYISASHASRFIATISVSQAARLVGVSATSIKSWREQHPELMPGRVSGRTNRGVVVDALLKVAEVKYREEPKLIKRTDVPAIFAAQVFQRMADNIGIFYKDLLDALKIPEDLRGVLENKGGLLPRARHAELMRLAAGDGGFAGPVSDDGVAGGSLGAKCSGLDLEVLALSPRLVRGLIEKVSCVRGVPAERVYSFARSVLNIPVPWPSSLQELAGAIERGDTSAPFPIALGVLLNLIANPVRGLYTYGKSQRGPVVGDVFVHTDIRDFGLIESLETVHGSLVAQVALARRKETVTFDLSPD